MKTLPFPALALLIAGCTVEAPPPTTPSPAPAPVYRAVGQEPGWTVTIDGARIVYSGDYGETNITVPRPEPRTSFNGHRYEAPRLTVDITHSLCHDGMSGHAYADRVIVTADGKTVNGCGGERLPAKDN